MGLLSRGSRSTVGQPASVVNDPDMRDKLPVLYDFLTLTVWDDGDPREPGTVLIMAQDGMWKVWLNDKDGDRTAFLSADTFIGLLAMCDARLGADSVPWRRAGEGRKGGRKSS